MVNDKFGVKKIYADSTRNPQSWFLSSASDSRTKEGGDLGGVSFSGGIIKWSSGNDKARWNVYTTAGYSGSKIDKNHKNCASRGYMMDPKDWRDIEMTAYWLINAGADDQAVMYSRGGTHTGDGNCEGFAYKADLYYSGKTRFAKEQWHVSYEFTSAKNAMGSVEGKWVGMKFCIYNTGTNSVTMEIWLDKNNNNTWVKVDSYVDKGGFGSNGSKCGGSSDQVGTWGGPNATYRWDNANSVSLQKCSVREINPTGQPNEGGSNPGGGSGDGGAGGGGGNTDNPPSGGGSGGTPGGTPGDTDPPPGSSGPTGPDQVPEPPPIFTIYVDRTWIFNIGVDTEDNCTAGLPLEIQDYESIYNIAGEPLVYQDLGYGTGAGKTQVGIYCASDKSIIYKQRIRKIIIKNIRRTVDGTLTGPTGNLRVIIVSTKNNVVRAQIGGLVSVPGIDVNEQAIELIQPDMRHQVEVGDAIVIEYVSGDANVDRCLKFKHTTKDMFDSVDSYLITRNNAGWDITSNKDKDPGFELFI